MTPKNKTDMADVGKNCQPQLTVELAVQLVMLAAKALGDGRQVRVLPHRHDVMIRALDLLTADRGPDARLSNLLGVPYLATRRECVEMIRGRLNLRPAVRDAFADEGVN